VALCWLFLAAAVSLVGGGQGPSSSRRGSSPVRRGLSLRALQCVVGVAVAAGCLATFGVGRGVLAAAVGVPVAAVSVAHLHRRPQRVAPTASLALTLDLVALGLRAGQPLAGALLVAAPASDRPCRERLNRVGGLLQLGADAADAWRVVVDDPVLAPVAAAAVRSSASGVRLASAFEQLSGEIRRQVRATAEARAHRVGVLVAAPLGLCFLPAFVCLGIVPTVIGIARGVLVP
jgi:Flp pilus assembly protein TadB